ncbi:MAG: specificity determinant for hsdM and hsdR [Nitrospirae bacterium]|nr:MAG: specificity determinant for hsdM and hsdR [Nitrospirota bacterium]
MAERLQPSMQERESLDPEQGSMVLNEPVGAGPCACPGNKGQGTKQSEHTGSPLQRNLPEGWEWKTLGDIAEVCGGGTPRTNDPANFEGGSIPWVTPADLSGYTSKKIGHGSRNITEKGLLSSSARLLPSGTVLFTSRAPIGYVAIAANPIATNQGFKSFVLKEGILPDYVYWYLKGSKDLAESLASGTTFLELSGAKAKQLPIPVAPLSQQKLIVAEIEKQFSRLDEAVAGLKRIKANLKRYKAAVLKAAVEGKLTEEWRKANPNVEAGAELLKRILVERKMKWEEKNPGKKYKEPVAPDISNLPELPEGWVWASVDSICHQIGDVDHKMPKAKETGIPYISTKDFSPDGGINYENAKRIDQSDYDKLCRKIFPEKGDILLSRYGTVGEVRLVRNKTLFQASYSIAILKPLTEKMSAYLSFVLQTEPIQRQIKKHTRATAQPDLGLSHIRCLGMPLAPTYEQQRIIDEIDHLFSVADEIDAAVETNLKRAERLRQGILTKAFSARLALRSKSTIHPEASKGA